MQYVTLVPAYGRDYKSAKEVKAAWAEGKDFQINDMSHPNDGSYVNINDDTTGLTFNVRYKRLTGVAVIKGGKPKTATK